MGATDVRAHRARYEYQTTCGENSIKVLDKRCTYANGHFFCFRSHGIFTIKISQKENSSSKMGVTATITLADLAGTGLDECAFC